MAVSIALMIGTGLPVHASCRRASCPSEDQGRFNISTEGDPGHRLRRDGPPPAAGGRRSSPRIRTSSAAATTSAAGRGGGGLNQGRIAIDLKPRTERKRIGRSDHRRTAAEAVAGAGHARLHGQPAADQPRRPAGRAQPLSVHAAGHRHRGAVPAGRRSSKPRSASFPASRTCSSDLQIKNPQIQVDMDRDKISALGLTVNQVETALYNALRHAPGVADLRAEQSVSGDPAGRAGVPEGSGGAVDAVRPIDVGQPGAQSARPAQHRGQGDDRAPGRSP